MCALNYSDISAFIDALNTSGVAYVILRNHENIKDASLYVDGHGDVDLLCEDSRLMAKALGAKPYHHEDGVHYYVKVAGEKVSLDLRSVGDGYYCTPWQQEMLQSRVQENGIWVMNLENYLYSLIHHAILQKRSLSEEYSLRLKEMSQRQGVRVETLTERSFISILEKYMIEKGYFYVYPRDFMVPLRTSIINKQLLQRNFSLAYQHWKFDTKVKAIEFLVKVKHLLEGKGFKYA